MKLIITGIIATGIIGLRGPGFPFGIETMNWKLTDFLLIIV